jgi:uncharacterized protein YkwD
MTRPRQKLLAVVCAVLLTLSVLAPVVSTAPGIDAPTDVEMEANDLDGDGRYEDTNGNGEFNVGDVQWLFIHYDEGLPVEEFDFNGDGELNIGDVQRLFVMRTRGLSAVPVSPESPPPEEPTDSPDEPTPTPTPTEPPQTPAPTPTPSEPPETSEPTETPQQTPPTPEPTETPEPPSETPTTSEPTATPSPTPDPTETPDPTPEPTPEPTPDPTEPHDPDDPGVNTYESDAGETISSTAVERRVHELVNERRASNGLDALGYRDDLASVSRAHSEDMADRDFFSHGNPDGESITDRYGPTVWDTCSAYGENILYTYVDRTVRSDALGTYEATTTDELAYYIVEGWMNSPGHRENILDETWTAEGIGVYFEDTRWGMRVYATQNFCTGG